MNLELVRKGNNCVQTAQAAYAAITRQDPNLHQVIEQQEATLNDEVASVGQMERDLSNAQHRLHQAKKKQKKKRRFKLFGAAVGFAFGGLGGAVLGGILGAGVAKLAPSDQIQRAKAEIAH